MERNLLREEDSQRDNEEKNKLQIPIKLSYLIQRKSGKGFFASEAK